MLAFWSSLRQRGFLTSTLIILNPQQPGDASAAVVLVPLFTSVRTPASGASGLDLDLSPSAVEPEPDFHRLQFFNKSFQVFHS